MKDILLLMSRSKIPMFWGKRLITLGEEEKLCIEFADQLRAFTIERRLKGIWTHLANEGKRGILVAMIAKAMGMISGATDYVFLWEDGCGVIEFKTKKGRLSPNQVNFKAWCEMYNVRYALCRSVDEGLETLRGWGNLT